jgi:hypothetical protein
MNKEAYEALCWERDDLRELIEHAPRGLAALKAKVVGLRDRAIAGLADRALSPMQRAEFLELHHAARELDAWPEGRLKEIEEALRHHAESGGLIAEEDFDGRPLFRVDSAS